MKIYNTLNRKKEEFKPLDEGKVKMYVCGPTVYDFFHIGNGRTFIVFDMVRRYLEYRGYEVQFVQNFTDIDDKMIKRAIEENCTVKQVGDKYIKEYYKDSDNLNIERATSNPRATEYIEEIIDFVSGLIKRGYAYESDGDVYFSTNKFEEYGKLSKQNLEQLKLGASERLNVETNKKDPMDFVIWKKEKPGEPSWNSPWGLGRPGWHIECSCMAKKILGDTIDIHAGGMDLIFPHHENEIAQSEALTGKKFSNYWMHSACINIDAHKRSKSKNNFFTARDILKEYNEDVIRFFMFSAHYRMQINFSRELLESAKASVNRLYNTISNLENLMDEVKTLEMSKNELQYFKLLDKYRSKFIDKMDDDFNTADAITVIFDLSKEVNNNIDINASKELVKGVLELIRELGKPLGILQKKTKLTLEDEVEQLIEDRQNARKNKDFQLADKIRDDLKNKGIILEDTQQGVRWHFQK